MTDIVFVYITASSTEDAGKIAQALVEERLAACVNLIPGMRSVYRWKGKIEQAQETVLVAKTQANLFGRLSARVKTLHAYDCPCIVAMPVVNGSPDFLDWVRASTTSEHQG